MVYPYFYNLINVNDNASIFKGKSKIIIGLTDL